MVGIECQLFVLLATAIASNLVIARVAAQDLELEIEGTSVTLESKSRGEISSTDEPRREASSGSRASRSHKGKHSYKCGLAPLNKLSRRKSRSVVGPEDHVAAQVINGDDQQYGSWPSFVGLTLINPTKGKSCGGTLVTDRHVLTAGHCTSYNDGKSIYKPNEIKVKLANHHRFRVDKYELNVSVKKVCQSPKFRYLSGGHTPLHDWSILELKEPVKLSDHIQPACLAQRQPPTRGSGAVCYLVGTGLTKGRDKRELDLISSEALEPSRNSSSDAFESRASNKDQTRKDIVQELRVHQVDCGNYLSRDDKFRACYSGVKTGASCMGDSGGPILCLSAQNRWTVTGIVSYGSAHCDHRGKKAWTSVYADVQGAFADMMRDCPSIKGHPMS